MPGGRPRKPTEQKRKTGRSPGRDTGGRPLPEPTATLPAVADIPPAPETLGSIGRVVWERLWSAGKGWLSITTDVDLLTRLCQAHDERDAMRQQIAADGLMVLGSQGQLRPHPLLAHLRALEAQMTRWEGLCGFTPSDRSRLGYAEVRTASKLDELIARRSAKKGSA